MLDIKIISDLASAQELWELLSPNESLYDRWDFRYCFYRHDPHPLRFYTAYDKGVPVALLPLQYNRALACLEFFAENFMEDNRPFFAAGYEEAGADLFRLAGQEDLKVFDLTAFAPFVSAWPLEDYIYYIDLKGIGDFGDYLRRDFHDAHKRSNFKRLFTLLERDHKVTVGLNNFADLDAVMDLNVASFGDESYLRLQAEREPFKEILRLPLDWRLLTVSVDGRCLAGSLSVVYNNIYYYLIIGADISEHPNVFKYLTKVNLELAIQSKTAIFNCSLGDCGWKKHWHMSTRPQYKLVCPPAPQI